MAIKMKIAGATFTFLTTIFMLGVLISFWVMLIYGSIKQVLAHTTSCQNQDFSIVSKLQKEHRT